MQKLQYFQEIICFEYKKIIIGLISFGKTIAYFDLWEKWVKNALFWSLWFPFELRLNNLL